MKKTLHFLLLEDSLLDAEFLLDQLGEGGWQCTYTRVETRQEFESALLQERFDLILADYSLPLFNGMDALSIAQELHPEIPFIFVSGRLGEELAIESLKKGATDYVVKHRLERLVPAVARALAESEEREERRRIERSLAVLSEASIVLAASLDYQTTLSSVARLAVPHFADFCVVDIIAENGRISRLDVAHSDSEFQSRASQLLHYAPRLEHPNHPLPRVLATGKAELIPHLDHSLLDAMTDSEDHASLAKDLGVSSVMVVPLEARGRVLGAMTFVSCSPDRVYSEVDLMHAEDLARRAGLAVDNAQLHHRTLNAVRLRDEFLATVSHELRTPLNAILGWVALLRTDALQDGEEERALETIERNARAQAKLIEDLLDVSRIISGKLTISHHPVDLRELIEIVIRGLQPTAAAKNVDCRLVPAEGEESRPTISGDSQRLQQIVWNLLSNAVKFSPSGGQVEVTLTTEGGDAIIIVDDSGPGISPEFLPFVFDRFSQADGSTTRRHGGLGLGLAIVRHLTELHGGSVGVESPCPLGGASFSVRLPLLTEEPQPIVLPELDGAMPKSAQPNSHLNHNHGVFQSLRGLRVLVVDDDTDGRDVMAASLRSVGADVLTADSVSAAMSMIERQHVDVLLSDIGMPDEDGYKLIERVRDWERATGKHLPAAAVTAYTRDKDRQQALNAGFQAHVPKPVEPAQLTEIVLSISGAKAPSGSVA